MHQGPLKPILFGTETEYGIANVVDGKVVFGADIKKRYPPGFLWSGGRIYRTVEESPLEGCTPLVSSVHELIAYEHALPRIARDLGLVDHVYKNNVDHLNKTFGYHENYLVSLKIWDRIKEIVPFLVSRIVLSGNGTINDDGKFELSQRARFITELEGKSSTGKRGIINKRDQPLSPLTEYKRLHLILSDTNMCDYATFLKIGTLLLVLRLLEDDALPDFDYDSRFAAKDLQELSKVGPSYRLIGTGNRLSAIDVQQLYVDAVKKKGEGGLTPEEREVLFLWEETLFHLRDNQERLVGKIDWVTKKVFLTSLQRDLREKNFDHKQIRSVDLEYHGIFDDSFFQWLVDGGHIARMVSEKDIERAMTTPPSDTSSYYIGAARRFASQMSQKSSRPVVAKVNNWSHVTTQVGNAVVWGQPLVNPYNNYRSEYAQMTASVEDFLGKLG